MEFKKQINKKAKTQTLKYSELVVARKEVGRGMGRVGKGIERYRLPVTK